MDTIEEATPATKTKSVFADKNLSRKENFQGGNTGHRESRAVRRNLGGAFGTADSATKEMAVVGTGGFRNQ